MSIQRENRKTPRNREKSFDLLRILLLRPLLLLPSWGVSCPIFLPHKILKIKYTKRILLNKYVCLNGLYGLREYVKKTFSLSGLMQVFFYMYKYIYIFLKQEKSELCSFEKKKTLVLKENYLKKLKYFKNIY